MSTSHIHVYVNVDMLASHGSTTFPWFNTLHVFEGDIQCLLRPYGCMVFNGADSCILHYTNMLIVKENTSLW